MSKQKIAKQLLIRKENKRLRHKSSLIQLMSHDGIDVSHTLGADTVLHDGRLPLVQRQQLARELGYKRGNRYLAEKVEQNVGHEYVQKNGDEGETAVSHSSYPAWLADIYTQSGALTAEQARQMLTQAGLFVISRHMKCLVPPENETDAQRVHLAGKSRAHLLDWDSVHAKIAPANPKGKGTVTGKYGSLRRVFYSHRQAQLQASLGVSSVDQVITAVNIAQDVGRADVADTLNNLLFRANQYAIVETLNVSTSARYAPEPGKTFCNIYAYDFVTAMGGYLPRVWWTDTAWQKIEDGAEIISQEELKRLQTEGESTENVVAPIYGKTVSEQNANALNKWIRAHGGDFGWKEETDMTAAQDAANGGSVVIILAANQKASRSGHVTVVLMESREHRARRDEAGNVIVPLQSQAGASNFKYGGKGKWWADKSHKEGAAWIFEGELQSPLITPEQLGVETPSGG